MDVQSAKQLVWEDLWACLADDVELWGPAPIGRLDGRAAVVDHLLTPLQDAIPDARWQPYLFLGGTWQGETWVAATGDIVGTMRGPWCSIPPTDGGVRLRYGVFHRIDGAKAVEIRLLFDILGLAAQAGYQLLPSFAGRPGPPPTAKPRGGES